MLWQLGSPVGGRVMVSTRSTAEIAPARASWLLPAGFFTLLFFLGSADAVFATRVHQMNFRWGQLLLMAGVLLISGRLLRLLRTNTEERRILIEMLGPWLLFFAVYGFCGVRAGSGSVSLVKLAWGVFNIGGALLLSIEGNRRRAALTEGFTVACMLLSTVILVDAVALYWAELPGGILGLSQQSYPFEGILPQRPHAFYYEPSYAGAMLAFATPLLFVSAATLPRSVQILAPALSVTAVMLTSARTGVLGVGVACVVMALWAAWQRQRALLVAMVRSLGMAVLILAIFFGPPRARIYLHLIAGPLGFAMIYQRLFLPPPATVKGAVEAEVAPKFNARSSEGARMTHIATGLDRWRESLLFGWGVNDGAVRANRAGEGDRSIHTTAQNTWIEVALESGLAGLLTFLLAIGLNIRTGWRRLPAAMPAGVLVAAWVTHFAVNLNLTQTFPRLDYWLLFFCSIRMALPDIAATVASSATPVVAPAAPVLQAPAQAAFHIEGS